jgi:LuxR family transcriptional regulator, quorum-sensing system regulator BjaR1
MSGSIQQFASDVIEKMDSSKHIDDITQVISLAGKRFGFENFALSGLPKAGESVESYVLACGWPDGWSDRYFEKNYVHSDPVVQHVRRAENPFFWKDAQLQDDDRTALTVRNEAKEFGLVEGFAIPMRTSDGAEGIATFGAINFQLNKNEQAALCRVAIYAFQTIQALARNGGISQPFEKAARQLSLRELDCLKWTAAGKTSYEISIITGLSQRTVEHYLANAAQKLSANNKAQAVAIAIRKRIIS